MSKHAKSGSSGPELPTPIHVNIINKTGFEVQVHKYYDALPRRRATSEPLPANESLTRITEAGWNFQFVGAFGNLLYSSLVDDDLAESRCIRFKTTEDQGGLTDASNPLTVYVHKSRYPVTPDLESVDADGRPLHSLTGDQISRVAFYNSSARVIAAYWLSYRGMRVHYADIQPGHSMMMETFVTHPWVFVDEADRLDMLVNDGGGATAATAEAASLSTRSYKDSRPYFFPSEFEDARRRHLVVVHPRLHSLKTLAMAVVRQRVARKELRLTQEFVPASLIREVDRPPPKRGHLSLDEMQYFR